MADNEVVEEVVEDVIVEEVVSDQPEGLREEDLGALYDEATAEEPMEAEEVQDDRPRGPDGKFIAKEEAEAAPEEEAAPVDEIQADGVIGQTVDEEPVQATPDIPAPSSWSDEAKAHWSELGPELQQKMLQQETARQQVDEQKNEYFRQLDPIVKALEPAVAHIQMSGQQPAQYVQTLVAADQYLRTDPQAALRWIAKQYNVQMDDFESEGYDQPAPDLTPVLSEVDQLKQQVFQLKQQQEQAQSETLSKTLEAFAADKPHFETVRVQMGKLIDGGVAEDLQSAYDMAVWANPTTRAEMMKPSAEVVPIKDEAAQKAATAKRRIAATNLSSQGTHGGNAAPAESEEDLLGQTFDRMQG
jgi:hypothetical protein